MRSQKRCTPQLNMQSVRDPDLGLEENIGMMQTICINHGKRSSIPKRSQESYRKSRDNSGREPKTNGRKSAMAAIITCHTCERPRDKKKDCKELMGKSDKPSNVENGSRKWCSYHHSKSHSNKDCYQQQQSGKGGARITRVEVTRMTSVITREVVAIALPLTVKVQTMRRSLRTVI